MIPDEAVEAAREASLSFKHQRSMDNAANHMRHILEAAAPHLLAEVTTRAEQVNLPNGTVILSEQGGVFQHFNGYWFEPGSSYLHHIDEITLPATVIHRPTP